jgi:hypothetical protein
VFGKRQASPAAGATSKTWHQMEVLSACFRRTANGSVPVSTCAIRDPCRSYHVCTPTWTTVEAKFQDLGKHGTQSDLKRDASGSLWWSLRLGVRRSNRSGLLVVSGGSVRRWSSSLSIDQLDNASRLPSRPPGIQDAQQDGVQACFLSPSPPFYLPLEQTNSSSNRSAGLLAALSASSRFWLPAPPDLLLAIGSGYSYRRTLSLRIVTPSAVPGYRQRHSLAACNG